MTPTPAPAASVIIPAYRVTPYIGEALESLRAQTFRDFETIVVNDGCPDTAGLEAALRPYRTDIVYLTQANGGVSAARNAGLRAARAPLIAFLDGDDAFAPDYLAVQVEYLRSHPQIDIVYCDGRVFGDAPRAGRRFMELSPSHGTVSFESLLSLRCSVPIHVTARKAALLGVGGFDEGLRRAEDFDLWLRAAHAGARIAYHERALFHHRHRTSSNLSANPIAMREAGLQVLAKTARTLSLSSSEKATLEKTANVLRGDVAYHRMKDALRARDRPAALAALRELLRIRWTVKHALLGAALQWAPRPTMWIVARRAG